MNDDALHDFKFLLHFEKPNGNYSLFISFIYTAYANTVNFNSKRH